MKSATLRILAAGAACLAAASAHALDNPTVWNTAHYSAAVVVRYAACKADSFTVPAATIQGPGRATASSNRGACLITSVSATLNSATYKVTDYSSSGTSYSQFLIRYMGDGTYKVYSDKELTGIWDREKGNENSPEGGFSAKSARQSMSKNPLAECQTANKAAIAELKARFAAGSSKLTKAQKDKFEATRKSLLPIPGKAGNIDNCKQKTATIAAWKAETDKMLGTK